jgi:hypothetical protein
MQINIPAMFGPICFSGSLEEDFSHLRQVNSFLGILGFLHDIAEILLKLAFNTINPKSRPRLPQT